MFDCAKNEIVKRKRKRKMLILTMRGFFGFNLRIGPSLIFFISFKWNWSFFLTLKLRQTNDHFLVSEKFTFRGKLFQLKKSKQITIISLIRHYFQSLNLSLKANCKLKIALPFIPRRMTILWHFSTISSLRGCNKFSRVWLTMTQHFEDHNSRR